MLRGKRHARVARWATTPLAWCAGLVALAVGTPLTGLAAGPADALIAYTGTLRPLLAERCVSCHGSLQREAGLRLDTAALMAQGGESGSAIARDDPDASLILARVSDPNPASRMPPEGEGEPLTADQIAALRAWIAAGCPAPADEKPEPDPRDHWAFKSRVRPAVPPVADASTAGNPIDAFLAAAREQAGVMPQPEAPRHVLVRRLYLDLVGLPPQPEELAALEADTSPGWYEALVDRLLADPRHGERWARHWMDVWRYSDWWGLGEEHRRSQKHMWHFRDWIIESLNADLPYDEMLRQMLAADELYPEDPAKLRATGFLARNWFIFNRTPWLDDTVEHVGKGLLGLTLNCAKCHAHKYDPIRQEDYYRFRAFFEPIEARLDVVAGESDLTKNGMPRVFDAHLERPTYLFIRGEDTKPDPSRTIEPGVPAVLEFAELMVEPVSLPKAAFEPVRLPWVLDAHVATAERPVAAAEAVVAKAAAKRTAAATGLAATTPEAPTRAAAIAAEQAAARELATAEAALAVEKAVAAAVRGRAEAMRAAWAAEAAATPETAARRQEAARAAVRAERGIAVAQARRKVVEVEGRVAAAKPDAKEKAEQELASARTAVETAVKAAAEPGEAYAPLVGAKWTATRVKESRTDDPPVAFPATSTGRRTALARWITDPRNPLTARVAVNHIWMRHMGTPLVASVFEFGRKGNTPTHPALLDWLASELVEGPHGAGTAGSGWRMKHLHRLICTSAAYRMSSAAKGAESAARIDPDNHLLWRRVPIRLEAQVVRDAILALAGTLDPTMGGPPVPAAAQAASRRRSLYFWHSEISGNPFLATFDDAAPRECYQRDQSIVPQQALALANAAVVHDAASQIASRLQAGAGDDAAFIERAFGMIVNRAPTADERAACEAALAKWRALGRTPPNAADPARTHLVWALLNHNDFVTLR